MVHIDKIIRSRRRSIGLTITSSAQLIIRAPLSTPVHEIERLVAQKSRWIVQKQAFFKERQAVPSFNLSAQEKSNYKEKAVSYIEERVKYFADLTKLRYASIRINDTKTRWGSCNSEGKLCFCWRLILAPSRVIDYVVVHELMHLKQMNHSAKFWNEVKALIPDYKQDAQWLKQNGYRLSL